MPGGGIFLSISIIELRCIPSGHAGTHRPAGLRIAQPHALPEAPVFERPFVRRATPAATQPKFDAARPIMASLVKLMGSPDLCSRRWVWEQYDTTVMADTVQVPGGDAAVVRVHGSNKALAISCDVTPRYCEADPFEGGKQAVAEAYRNIVAVGGTPRAITDNLNFGNPERPDYMGQLVYCIRGIGAACEALDFPVVSGNVSLYNETNGRGILPTPTIGGVGVVDDVSKTATPAFKAEGEFILLIGETKGWLGASAWFATIAGREEGAPPPVDLEAEKKHGAFISSLIQDGHATACHDLSDGGLAIALAEMALAGKIGAKIDKLPEGLPSHAALFGEDQARYLVTVKDQAMAAIILKRASSAGVPALMLGKTGGHELTLPGESPISLERLKKAHEREGGSRRRRDRDHSR